MSTNTWPTTVQGLQGIPKGLQNMAAQVYMRSMSTKTEQYKTPQQPRPLKPSLMQKLLHLKAKRLAQSGRCPYEDVMAEMSPPQEESNDNLSISGAARLRQDYMRLKKDPVPYIFAEPLPSNIFEWHYVVLGPDDTPYEGGIYHGKMVFPREFPFKPPSIYMITPNGRFSTKEDLCLTISDSRPQTFKKSPARPNKRRTCIWSPVWNVWSPVWNVSSILCVLLSFMTEESFTQGCIKASEDERKKLAQQSLSFNLQDQEFCEIFPELVDVLKSKLEGTPSKLEERDIQIGDETWTLVEMESI